MDRIEMMCGCGASIQIVSQIANSIASDWRKDHLNCPQLLKPELPTTVEPTPTARTVEGHWDADKMVYSYTIPTTPPSSQSDQVDTPSGPAEHNSECVHQWEYSDQHLPSKADNNWGRNWCHLCGALWFSGKTHVPAARHIFSTSARGASSRFVENSPEESVTLPSKELTEDQLHWLDVGGNMAMDTITKFIEGRRSIKRNDLKLS